MRLTLFLFFIVNINAMENFNAALQEVSDSDEINKLCWYLNGLKIKGISELTHEILLAAYYKHRIAALKLLRAFGWDIDKEVPEFSFCGWSPNIEHFYAPLTVSCRYAHFKSVVFLTYLGANLNKKNITGHNNILVISSGGQKKKIKITQFLLSQNAQQYNNEYLIAKIPECKALLQSKKRPPIPNKARTMMLDWAREKKNIACILRKRELGIK